MTQDGPAAEDEAAGQVGLVVNYERISKARTSLSVRHDGKLRHQDTLNLGSAAARARFAGEVAARLGVDRAAVEERLLALAAELEAPTGVDGGDVDRPTLANADGDGRGLPIDEIAGDLRTMTGGWPRRVGDRLFARTADDGVLDLGSPAKLFAWADGRARVVWSKGADRVTQERFFEHLRMTTEAYESVETQPHWPPRPGVYYLHPGLPEDGGGRLEQLLDFLRPETAEDRHLLKALWATPGWGGKPGSQPAFLLLGPEDDAERMGRGVGKSTLTELVGLLYGGFVDISPQADIDKIKTRLLSRAARQLRVARLDNVKSFRFSWGDLENLITTPLISGHEMYEGEGRRPNTVTWLITLNGASLSKDLAERVVIIRLARPEYGADWGGQVRAFIEAHRGEILRDIGTYLGGPAAEHFRPGTRWAEWEAGVLARGPIPVRCRKAILRRQAAVDADASERDLVVAEFRAELRVRGHDPECDRVFIPSKLAAEWLSAAARVSYETNRATVQLKTLGVAELIPDQKSNGVPGWEWRGPESTGERRRRMVKDRPSDPAKGGAPRNMYPRP